MIRVGFLLMASYAQAFISIQVQNTLIEYGSSDLDISCIVNGTSLKSVQVIQLKRNDTNIVLKAKRGVSWQDTKLQARSKLNASINSTLSSYLHLKIMACDVNQTIDEGSYQCTLVATGNKIPSIQENSNKLNLKITGSPERKQEKCALHSHAMFVKGSIFFFMKIALIRMMSYWSSEYDILNKKVFRIKKASYFAIGSLCNYVFCHFLSLFLLDTCMKYLFLYYHLFQILFQFQSLPVLRFQIDVFF